MNPTIQSGMHPDADMLTAFAEQLISAEDREQILAHMATCSRCREVMFLAQQAAGAEAMTAPAGASELVKKTRAGWLGGSRWVWIPAGALATLIGVAALTHFRRVETETQMARNVQSSDALEQASPTPTAGGALTNPQPRAVEEAKASAERDKAPAKQKEELKALDDEKRVGRREASAVSKLGAAAPSITLSSGFVGGSVHGAMTARGKDSSYGGPIANQLQQNANQQNAALQNQFQSAQGLNEVDANKPGGAGAGGSVGAASETVTVQSAAVAPASAAKSAPAAAPQVPYVPMSGRSFDVSSGAMANLKKAPKIVLPGGSEALSSTSAAGRTIAIDTAGALFLSLDNGKSWQPVTTQWIGRAVLVRNSPGSEMAGAKTDAAKVDRLQGAPEVRFELVTDKLQTWTSADGKTWTAEVPPSK